MDLLDLPAVWLRRQLVAACVVLGAIALNRHNALLTMRRSERNFRDLYDNISEGVFRSTLDGRMISANPALVRLNGFDSEAEMLSEVNDIAGEWYVDPNRRAEIHAMLSRRARSPARLGGLPLQDARAHLDRGEHAPGPRPRTGQPLYYDGTVREVTETVRRLRAPGALRQDRVGRLRVPLPVSRMRPDGTSSMPYASSGLTQIFGVDARGGGGGRFGHLRGSIHPDDRASVSRVVRAFGAHDDAWPGRVSHSHDGRRREMDLRPLGSGSASRTARSCGTGISSTSPNGSGRRSGSTTSPISTR